MVSSQPLLTEQSMNKLVSAIVTKNELKGIEEGLVRRALKQYVRTHTKEVAALEQGNPKSQSFRSAVKSVRAVLREVYGVFQKESSTQREKLLLEYTKAGGVGERLRMLNQLLLTHQSTAERASYYPTLYKEIFSTTGLPMSILDLGCGLNPLSYRWLGCEPEYHAQDVGEEVTLVQTFFEHENIEGSVTRNDLVACVHEERVGELCQPVDIVFLFKLIDTLETQERGLTKKLLPQLNTKHIIASFPTVSISGKRMRTGGVENWFTRFIDLQGWKYTTHIIPGEEFYIILKEH
jgi:16S rRNA (guanine(1405)-N(7))-methyltransferase